MTEKQEILIVDDRTEDLVALRQALGGVDAEIVEVASGDQALAATLDHQFALAILDMQMSAMSGYELAAHLRGDEKT
jgi:CheY-like chemotaxis protein